MQLSLTHTNLSLIVVYEKNYIKRKNKNPSKILEWKPYSKLSTEWYPFTFWSGGIYKLKWIRESVHEDETKSQAKQKNFSDKVRDMDKLFAQ